MTKAEKNLTGYLQSPQCTESNSCRQIMDVTLQESGNSYERKASPSKRWSMPENTRVIHWFDIAFDDVSGEKVEIIVECFATSNHIEFKVWNDGKNPISSEFIQDLQIMADKCREKLKN